MSASLRALLAGVIDYAGIFPPAELALDTAIHDYARLQKSRDRWMLGRFVVPAARLAELAAFEKIFEEDPPFVFSVLGRGGQTSDEFLQGVTEDLANIVNFRERHAGLVEVDVFETKLPDELVRPENYHIACYTLVRVAEEIETFGPPALTPFFEIGLPSAWRDTVECGVALLRHLASYGELRMHGLYQRCRTPGFKLRCGGRQATMFPTPEQVAHILVACRDASITIKATAGLHHPFRHYDDALKTHVHGFLNIFSAAALAIAHHLDAVQVQTIIEDEDARHFSFDNIGLRWKELDANVEQIAGARQQLAVGFGSCSFDEPRTDLRTLKLLK